MSDEHTGCPKAPIVGISVSKSMPRLALLGADLTTGGCCVSRALTANDSRHEVSSKPSMVGSARLA